jgi:hypothetical protein
LRNLFGGGEIPESFDAEARSRYLEWFFDTPSRKSSGFIDWLVETRGLYLDLKLQVLELGPSSAEKFKEGYGTPEDERMKKTREEYRRAMAEMIRHTAKDSNGAVFDIEGIADECVFVIDLRDPSRRKEIGWVMGWEDRDSETPNLVLPFEGGD